MAETQYWKELAERLRPILEDKDQDNSQLGTLLRKETPENIALDDECKSEVLAKLDPDLTKDIVKRLNLDQFANLIEDMSVREAADTISQASDRVYCWLPSCRSFQPFQEMWDCKQRRLQFVDWTQAKRILENRPKLC